MCNVTLTPETHNKQIPKKHVLFDCRQRERTHGLGRAHNQFLVNKWKCLSGSLMWTSERKTTERGQWVNGALRFKSAFCCGNIFEAPLLCLVLSLRVRNAAGDALCCSLCRAEGEPRCWSVFTASVERKGGRARADDLEGVQRQGPRWGEVPQEDPATAYLFLHFYFFFILFHSTAFISLSSQLRRTSTPALFPTNASHCVICWQAFSKSGNALLLSLYSDPLGL